MKDRNSLIDKIMNIYKSMDNRCKESLLKEILKRANDTTLINLVYILIEFAEVELNAKSKKQTPAN